MRRKLHVCWKSLRQPYGNGEGKGEGRNIWQTTLSRKRFGLPVPPGRPRKKEASYMDKVQPYSNIVKHGTKGVVILLSPNGHCWTCEKNLLPSEPRAVAVEMLTRNGLTVFLFLTCSEDCGHALEPEIRPGLIPRSLPPAEVSAFFRAKENIVGVVEGWRGLDRRPYYLVRGPFFDRENNEPEVAELLGLN